jgi:hypothetical protein
VSRRRNPLVSLRVTDRELSVLVDGLGRHAEHSNLREKLADAQQEVREAKRLVNREAKMGRLRAGRVESIEKDPQSYPPDPVWGVERGRFCYTDYDGESLTVRHEANGDVWADKLGQGPVYIRKEDVPVIVAAFEKTNDKENK